MNLNRTLRRGALCCALLCLSSTAVWAGCDNKDRPATPTNLKIGLGNPMPRASSLWALVLSWDSPQVRTGTTYHDIHVRDANGRPVPGMDVTGGAPSSGGSFGEYAWKQPPASAVYNVSMRARTKGGTEGCVSAAESETVSFDTGKFCWTPAHALVKCGAPLPP